MLLSTFFRMSFVIRDIWHEELNEEKDFKVNQDIFYLENYNYFGTERVGGTFSYLRKKYKPNIKSKLGHPSNTTNDDQNNENTSCKFIVHII